jgi:hypothetical protein
MKTRRRCKLCGRMITLTDGTFDDHFDHVLGYTNFCVGSDKTPDEVKKIKESEHKKEE